MASDKSWMVKNNNNQTNEMLKQNSLNMNYLNIYGRRVEDS